MFGNRIVKLRKGGDLTQDDLADILGITRQSLSHFELEKRKPDIEMLQKIADYFNVSTDYLLGRTEIEYPPGRIADSGVKLAEVDNEEEKDWDALVKIVERRKKNMSKK